MNKSYQQKKRAAISTYNLRKWQFKWLMGYATIAEWQEHQEIVNWSMMQAVGLASTPKQQVLELHNMI